MATTDSLPEITLYTNHHCPYAHRAHTTLKELNLPYEEVIIDLNIPREPWYLEVNPRGLVPSIKYTHGPIRNQILTESAIVSQFLADSFPSHLLPPSNASPEAAFLRARINFFVDTWNSKLNINHGLISTPNDAEQETLAEDWVAKLEKDIEPLLKDANPFFGGSKDLSFAEVQIAPFLLRGYSLSKGGVAPARIAEAIEKLPNVGKWYAALKAHPSVNFVYNEEQIVHRAAERLRKLRAKV